MNNIIEELKGGDLRSIGKSEEIVKKIIKNKKLFEKVFHGMLDKNPLIRMRSADIIEKASKLYPQYLQPFKTKLINTISKIPQQEVRWHTAQMFSYLILTSKDRKKVINILFSWLKDDIKSNIVKVMSLQTLADFAKTDKKLKSRVMKKINVFINSGIPSLKSRSQKLLKELTNIYPISTS